MIKRLTALLLCIGLLTGCAANGSAASTTGENAAVVPITEAAPQALTIYCGTADYTDTAAGRALQLYAEANDVTLAYTEDASAADLAVTYNGIDPSACRDLAADPLLAAAATRIAADKTQPLYALPVGRSLYAYWADNTILTALLGENAAADLQKASWAEWSDFITALTGWLAEPAETTVTLSGTEYMLPAEKPEAAANLTGALYAPQQAAVTADGLLTAALLAAGTDHTAETLTGPLNGVFAAMALEAENAGTTDAGDAFTADAAQALQAGKILFVRLPLADIVTNLGAEACAGLVPVPVKCALDETDITTTEYNLTGLMNYPTLLTNGSWYIPTGAEEAGAKAAAAALLWLYTSADGETALTETLGLVTPWGTAANDTAVGAMQVEWVGTGILPQVELTAAQSGEIYAAISAANAAGDWSKEIRDVWVGMIIGTLVPAE